MVKVTHIQPPPPPPPPLYRGYPHPVHMGVVREVLKEGTGRSPKHAECCVLHYIGTFASNGREFDNSRYGGCENLAL
jgi:hypothetical protein